MKNKRLYIFLAVLLSIVILLVNWQILAVHANISSKVSRAFREPDVIGWQQMSLPPGMPGLREGSALAYDSIRGVTILFGDCSAQALGDTWEWNGVTWTQRFPANSPSPRCFHTMAFDSARGVVVLFGGIGQGGGLFDDTWEWDGNNWTQRTSTNHPLARYNSAMAYDSTRGVTVLFSGHASNGLGNDTWEWDGNNWTQRSPANSPPGRHSHAMVYDSKRGVTVLFGGYKINQLLADTWEWDGINWVERQPVNYPQARFRHAMAYDSDRGVTVLFGGMLDPNVHLVSDETWEWDGSNWIECTLGVKPSARIYHTMAYDIPRHVTVLVGGNDGSKSLGDTWEYTGEAPSPTSTPTIGPSPTPTMTPLSGYLAIVLKPLPPTPTPTPTPTPPNTFYSTSDSTIAQGLVGWNSGDFTYMLAGYDDYLSNLEVVRSLVQFDLSGIPSGMSITNATLNVYYMDWHDYEYYMRTITTYRISSSWSEMEVTWQNQPSYAEAYGSAVIRSDDNWRYISFNVTDLVRAWENGTYPNYGIMLRGPEVSGSDSSWRMFTTREGNYIPYIDINYGGAGAMSVPPDAER
jgi:hypothetical protein